MAIVLSCITLVATCSLSFGFVRPWSFLDWYVSCLLGWQWRGGAHLAWQPLCVPEQGLHSKWEHHQQCGFIPLPPACIHHRPAPVQLLLLPSAQVEKPSHFSSVLFLNTRAESFGSRSCLSFIRFSPGHEAIGLWIQSKGRRGLLSSNLWVSVNIPTCPFEKAVTVSCSIITHKKTSLPYLTVVLIVCLCCQLQGLSVTPSSGCKSRKLWLTNTRCMFRERDSNNSNQKKKERETETSLGCFSSRP
jgi:hypothetical protein